MNQDSEVEQRWCPDTWQWYSLEGLQQRYSQSWGEKDILDHWDWKMQWKDEIWDKARSSTLTRSWNSLEFPHGLVHVARGCSTRVARYLFFKPPGYDMCKEVRWPVLFFLHGHHEIGKADVLASIFTGRRKEFDDFALANFLIICPFAESGSALLHDDGHQFDTDALRALCQQVLEDQRPKVDLDRVYCTGYSMGADAAATLACKWGSNLAAVALFAGSYKWFLDVAESEDINYDALSGVEIRCFHNESDSYIRVESTERFLDMVRKQLVHDEPSVRRVFIPYPSNVLSWSAHIKSLKEVTSHLSVRITEFDGGSKASWILKDAVHLADGHVCWPIVYRNESSFGLFHWMLSCHATRRPRVRLQPQSRLTLDSATQMLEALRVGHSENVLRHALAKLVAKVGRDKFTFLMHAQRLVFEIQRSVLEEHGFKNISAVAMAAALSEHLSCTLPEQQVQTFQNHWDEVRRALYGNMYNECWPPSEERGAEEIRPFPEEVVERARGRSQPFTSEQGLAMLAELRADFKKERLAQSRQKFQEKIKNALPLLTLDHVLEMQTALRDAFAQPEFQAGLMALKQQHSATPGKFQFLRAEHIFEAQQPVLVEYGFEGSRIGVHGMLQCFQTYSDVPDFKLNSDEINVLLGLEHRFGKTPEEEEASQARARYALEWFRNGR